MASQGSSPWATFLQNTLSALNSAPVEFRELHVGTFGLDQAGLDALPASVKSMDGEDGPTILPQFRMALIASSDVHPSSLSRRSHGTMGDVLQHITTLALPPQQVANLTVAQAIDIWAQTSRSAAATFATLGLNLPSTTQAPAPPAAQPTAPPPTALVPPLQETTMPMHHVSAPGCVAPATGTMIFPTTIQVATPTALHLNTMPSGSGEFVGLPFSAGGVGAVSQQPTLVDTITTTQQQQQQQLETSTSAGRSGTVGKSNRRKRGDAAPQQPPQRQQGGAGCSSVSGVVGGQQQQQQVGVPAIPVGDGSEDFSGPEEGRDIDRALKNRQSAARSRAKRQEYTNALQAQVEQLRVQNRALREMVIRVAAAPPDPHAGKLEDEPLRRTRTMPI